MALKYEIDLFHVKLRQLIEEREADEEKTE